MDLLCVRFYVEEGMRHAHKPIGEWLFDQAAEVGIPGGTAFRAAAGYGRHGLHADHFFELAGKLPEAVEFFASPEAIAALIARVGQAGLVLPYITYPVQAGITRP
ncbi:MAG: DUF190 domain-containing protein [Pseudomonadota bacterium]